ncbi:unnamed protein product [Rhizophagus irregularis]|uniref:Crinkler effector protein N-terminal domain-containing protein n=1 Tax=Rhizophagus irregularis TaxID=588596 RepID=A0A915Z031_9GLOM|nr:unnamed protein product [Rhizophagus irregularis]
MSADSNSIELAKSRLSTEKYYPGQEALISYLRKKSDKASYRGFLDLHYDDIVSSSSSSSMSCNELDRYWALHFLEVSEELLDQNAFGALKEKVKLERTERWSKTYWGNVVEDIRKRDKENRVLAHTEPNRKRKATEEPPAVITIWCLINEDPLEAAFPVDILDSKTIGHLKDAIRNKINAPDTVKAKNLEIWKVNVPFEEAEGNVITLDNIEVKRKLIIPATKICSGFDNIAETNINFIIKLPAATKPATTEDYVSPKLESNDVVSKRQRLLQECSGPPVSLFHPVFGQFLIDYRNHSLSIPAERYMQVQDFCNRAGQIYKNEGFRQKALRPFFTSLFDGIQPISIVTNNGSIDDDVLLTDNVVLGEKAVPILWEYKNEIGAGGKDPSIQGGCGYAKYWAQSQTIKIRNSSCCPSIILAIAGPWICVLGAVYLEKPVVEPLTDFILMLDRPEDDGKRIDELTIFFESLRLAFRTLNNYYKNLRELDETDAEKIQRFFPYRNQYQVDGDEIKFTYLYKLAEEPTNLTWKAETVNRKIVIVKFTKKSNHGLDENTLLYADDESFKGWRMVISEFKA